MNISETPVFHGTKHDVDAFDTAHVGSGEGNQQFGWGLYFADNKSVANWYHDKFQGKPLIVLTRGNQVTKGAIDRRLAHLFDYFMFRVIIMQTAERYLRTFEKQWEILDSWGNDLVKEILLNIAKTLTVDHIDEVVTQYTKTLPIYEDEQADWDRVSHVIVTIIKKYISVEIPTNRGGVYHVEVPDQAHYLYWDKPWSDQPSPVVHAINVDIRLSDTGGTIYKKLSNRLGSDKAASLELKRRGIVGIKFLNARSRGTAEQGYNYVIFDGADTKIVGRD